MAQADEEQRVLYDRMADEYHAHYSDEFGVAYRRQFINEPLIQGLDLRGAKVLEAMCGSGDLSAFLVEQGAQVTGLDNSPAMIAKYSEHLPQCSAVCGSIVKSGLPSESFDVIVVVGGLHHLHPHLDDAMVEIHRLLKPGGYFCFGEPPAGSALNLFRRIWYRFDRAYFAENEAAIDLDELAAQHSGRFEQVSRLYMGNFAYLFVFSSMILRMPKALKGIYSPALLRLEPLVQRVQGKRSACFAISQWRKR